MLQRFLDPSVLAGISGLDLVAKTVVDGFISGLHRSPDFGFSQEFAEYRAYNPGRRPAPRGLERVRALREDVSQALSRRDQLPGVGAAGLQPVHEIWLARDGKDGVREVSRGFHLLPGAPAARRGGADRFRQRSAAIRAAVDASGTDHATAARHRLRPKPARRRCSKDPSRTWWIICGGGDWWSRFPISGKTRKR